ncbi:hypothetical protein KP509_12G059700 [Ceratopteris richardii]|uniref:Uncharacterized protein n=1 Tax=Ceratopteris richardii TaxID=49495 RepID=A0A8T2TJK8_CERRI|nr:hypothetical protein KP509_12G059700 [Ceratopteris richardii]
MKNLVEHPSSTYLFRRGLPIQVMRRVLLGFIDYHLITGVQGKQMHTKRTTMKLPLKSTHIMTSPNVGCTMRKILSTFVSVHTQTKEKYLRRSKCIHTHNYHKRTYEPLLGYFITRLISMGLNILKDQFYKRRA